MKLPRIKQEQQREPIGYQQNDISNIKLETLSDDNDSDLDLATIRILTLKSKTKAIEIVQKKKWACSKCNLFFQTKRMQIAHRKAAHATVDIDAHTFKFDRTQELYVCNTCSAEFQDEAEVKKHMQIHEENFQCTLCNKKFKRAYDLGTHNAIHNEDKLFRCPLCTYKTSKRNSLLIHINYVHLKKFAHICENCGKGFNDVVLFKEHNNEHLGIRPFSCIVCAKSFTYSRYLYTHQIRTHKVGIAGELLPNQCPVCSRVFGKYTTLEKHCEEKHKKRPVHEKRHLCDTCGKGFSQKHKLQLHYRTHTGFKPYTCTYCGKSFTKKDYLIMHERVHSGEKPYSCDFCDKRFTQGAPLRIHLRSHTGEKPYVCQLCSTGFVSRSGLNTHCKTCVGQQ